MRSSRVIGAVAAILASLVLSNVAAAQSQWQQPAADLASQIAAILGHGPEKHETARLMIRNLSSLSVDEIPAIRKLLEQDLRTHGITANSAPNDTIIRVTLSEDRLDGLWVAEVIRGDDTQVAIVRVGLPFHLPAETRQLSLRMEHFWADSDATRVSLRPLVDKDLILAAADAGAGRVTVYADSIEMYSKDFGGWSRIKGASYSRLGASQRDPRGLVIPADNGEGFLVFAPGILCSGKTGMVTSPLPKPGDYWNFDCHASDDPWPVSSAAPIAPSASGASTNPGQNPPPSAQAQPPSNQIRAFYNAARNYFTGVVTPGIGVDLPPFYSAAVFEPASGTALLINSIDGRVLIASNGKLTAVKGTDDWGSDFALIQSGCVTGSQIIVSGADASDGDTLRAYQVTGSEATPSSAPLQIDGTVTALQTAPDGKSVLAVIRNAQNQYEVDRVTALCD